MNVGFEEEKETIFYKDSFSFFLFVLVQNSAFIF